MRKVSYKSLMSEISKLQKQAAVVRKTEVTTVVAGIQKQMQQLGLTVKDLETGGRKTRSSAASAKPSAKATKTATTKTRATKVATAKATASAEAERKRKFSHRRKPEAKFKDPVSGATWSGRGKTPLWMQPALAKGKSKAHFAIR